MRSYPEAQFNRELQLKFLLACDIMLVIIKLIDIVRCCAWWRNEPRCCVYSFVCW